ncbi:hypothetical protein TeGR_g4868 [Tetraparma gracilis]|uniref:Uncharacterized protein n=1 Tax=Tetraparma gracilis TaxID=2962635 RepID=A0ABQ6M878_9STRA|nr:hypothetical protein TeGR_g4868 [Tetraparma gracilis]
MSVTIELDGSVSWPEDDDERRNITSFTVAFGVESVDGLDGSSISSLAGLRDSQVTRICQGLPYTTDVHKDAFAYSTLEDKATELGFALEYVDPWEIPRLQRQQREADEERDTGTTTGENAAALEPLPGPEMINYHQMYWCINTESGVSAWVADRKHVPARRVEVLLSINFAIEQEKEENPAEPVTPLLRRIALLPKEMAREIIEFAFGGFNRSDKYTWRTSMYKSSIRSLAPFQRKELADWMAAGCPPDPPTHYWPV